MVIFVLTKNGFKEMIPLIKVFDSPIWINNCVLSENELLEYRKSGLDITNFSYQIDKDNINEIQGALGTIKEHHPEQNIWIEQ